MCDVRKSVVRLFVMGLAAGLLAGAVAPVNAQKKPQQRRARRETNASRQARIQRTIEETYSHRYEVFGGGGFLRFRPGEFLKKDNQISWAVNNTYYLNPKLGVIASAQGSFGHAEALQFNQNLNLIDNKPQINEYYFMAGPSYRFYMKEKLALSAQAQGGIGWGIFGGGSKGQLPAAIGLWPDSTRAAFSFGLSADYNLYPNLAFRITPQYIGTTFGGNVQNNVGFNAGVIYRFGHK
jgi:hypothetical protein